MVYLYKFLPAVLTLAHRIFSRVKVSLFFNKTALAAIYKKLSSAISITFYAFSWFCEYIVCYCYRCLPHTSAYLEPFMFLHRCTYKAEKQIWEATDARISRLNLRQIKIINKLSGTDTLQSTFRIASAS